MSHTVCVRLKKPKILVKNFNGVSLEIIKNRTSIWNTFWNMVLMSNVFMFVVLVAYAIKAKNNIKLIK